MAAKLIDLTSYRRSRRGRRKLKIAKSRGILSLCDARRLRLCGVAGERLRGLNYPKDHLVGPDEAPLGFMPPEENMSWLKRMMEQESDPEED
jgi:hypothetical protein